MRLHPRTQRSESTSLRVGDTNSVLSFPHCFVTNDVVEWRVSNSGSIRSAQERRESSLSSLISCRDKSWESYSATVEGRGRGRSTAIYHARCMAHPLSLPPLVIFFRPFIDRSY